MLYVRGMAGYADRIVPPLALTYRSMQRGREEAARPEHLIARRGYSPVDEFLRSLDAAALAVHTGCVCVCVCVSQSVSQQMK